MHVCQHAIPSIGIFATRLELHSKEPGFPKRMSWVHLSLQVGPLFIEYTSCRCCIINEAIHLPKSKITFLKKTIDTVDGRNPATSWFGWFGFIPLFTGFTGFEWLWYIPGDDQPDFWTFHPTVSQQTYSFCRYLPPEVQLPGAIGVEHPKGRLRDRARQVLRNSPAMNRGMVKMMVETMVETASIGKTKKGVDTAT